MMRKVFTILVCLFAAVNLFGKEWTFELSPSEIRMCSAKELQRPRYFVEKCGIKNMVNLSFFTSTSFIPPYKDSCVSDYRNPKNWPFLTIEKDGFPLIWDKQDFVNLNFETIINETIFIASGFPVLLRDGKKTKISKSFFARRKCPRTVVGIHPNGSLIVYVTTGATLKEVQNYFFTIGCTDAINFDGGSSTFLYLDGKKVFSSNQGRSYPNVLYWN